MARKINQEQAVELGQMISVMQDVDFENGEGKVVVFNNAVLILDKADDVEDSVSAQLVINDYERVEVDVVGSIDWESVIDDLLS